VPCASVVFVPLLLAAMASRSLCVLSASPLHFPAIVASSQRGSGGSDGIRLCAVMTRTSTSKSSVRMMTGPAAARRRSFAVTRAQAEDGGALTQEGGSWGEPVSLGTAILPPDVDLLKLEALLFQVLDSYSYLAFHSSRNSLIYTACLSVRLGSSRRI
jgi:pimeloyl-ACP methyl ester carboxylesterase